MDKPERRKLTLLVSDSTAGDLRRQALDLGLIAGRGPQVGQGSISQLLEAIGSGEIVLHKSYNPRPNSMGTERIQLVKDTEQS